MVALACAAYAEDRDQQMPASLDVLVPDYLPSEKVLRCPREGGKEATGYALVPGLDSDMPGDFILVHDKSPANHNGAGRNVAYLDGRVEWWPAAREAELQKRLLEQAERVRQWRQTRRAH